ncbi:glycerophosphoryl diester phosphodiesterase [Brevibacterium iodinum ATCC 49514]|uniref:Glycerophosphoryl diester phosphodiesterase n=1 Tax=Brevibacterium iodinum ATCC 49514 TaxID=1255616 RepID=A0A2H1JIL3_9MICO|nr:glycerophosphodiester phosphodiesterase family protein [Brevibacterium iodinum]SMX87241.1 glycerophosphoryl diester phosphodiesterase [Brevibacterium iodinum ATCC 49514]SUW14403.1 Glycerophosphoryl diester phosphodiesterase [Brevibacterium iodinum]
MPITLATPTSDHSPRDLTTGVTDTVIDPARVRVPPLVIAHRGASADWPENTIPAFIAGIDQGADMIETDVHMSADGELVIMHDTTVDRTTDARTLYPNRQDRSIAGMNAAQIATLDAGSWKGEEFAGVRVPRLAEVLTLAHDTRTGLLLEVKHPEIYPGIAEAVLSALRTVPNYLDRTLAAGMLVVQSANWAFVEEFHALAPEIPVGVLGRPCPDELQGFADWVDQVNPEFCAADADFLTAIHELGMTSLVWTVDDLGEMERAIDVGADGIITNAPDRLVEVVEAL